MMIKSRLLIMVITTPFVLSLFNLNKIYKFNLIKKLLQYIVVSKKIKSKSKLTKVKTMSKIHTKKIEKHHHTEVGFPSGTSPSPHTPASGGHTEQEKQMAIGLPLDNMYFDDE
jgi:hypothetical protein